jgi:hypothetical protein
MASSLGNRTRGLATATVVKTAEILGFILERITACSPQRAIFGTDELSDWPTWAMEALLETGLFQQATRAAEVFCDGCEWACLKPVVVRNLSNGRKSRAFVVCDEEPDQGRIEVAPDRLTRYFATVGSAARLVARSLGLKSSAAPGADGSLVIGRVRGRNGYRVLSLHPYEKELLLSTGGHRLPLSDLLHWEDRALRVDSQAIRRLINRKAAQTSPEYAVRSERPTHGRRKETKRDQQIRLQAARLKRKNKNWTITRISEHISRMELANGISAARVRRIIYEKK